MLSGGSYLIIGAYLIFFILGLFPILRFNVHMFQLNGYKNNEQRAWLIKNAKKQWVLILAIVLGILVFVLPIMVVSILAILWLIFCVFIFTLYSKQKAKKKLVFTPRVKRLITTNYIVILLVITAFVILLSVESIIGITVLLAGLEPLVLITSNIVNKPIEKGVNNYYINDAKRMLKEAGNILVIGVTGSYGKTSVKFFLNTLLREHFNVLVTPESFNTPMGVVRTIREHLNPMHEIFICEMGARYVGDIKELCDIVHPTHGIITSIGPQHLETFGDIERIKGTKFELADAIKGKGTLFLNGDNEYILDKSKNYEDIVFYHAKQETNGYYAKDIKVSNLGTEFTIVTPDNETEHFSMKLLGDINLVNVVGAIAVANTLGIELSELKIAVRRLEPVQHRLQLIERGNVTIIDDAFNSNPVGSKAAVEVLSQFEGVRILITPGMVELGEKEEEYNKKFGEYAAGCCDNILLVNKKRAKPIEEGALEAGFDANKIKVFDRLEEAMQYAYAINEPGHKYILLENDLPDNY